jgi:PhzF family phenazine biosynthesis protein
MAMRIPIFQVDAFASEVFRGNPAALCPLDRWLDDSTMQSIAAENNLPETAFFVREGEGYRLRWFTPTVEVELCGHATLAAGWLVLGRLETGRAAVAFATRSGTLEVRRADDGSVELDLPALPATAMAAPPALAQGLGVAPRETLRAANWLAVLEDEDQVRRVTPDFATLATLHPYGVIVTAAGRGCDFVSRFFGPSFGIPEDPVTGSAHCTLTPFWAARLGKRLLRARQVSKRGGELACEDRGDRVRLGGRCALYLEGEIAL